MSEPTSVQDFGLDHLLTLPDGVLSAEEVRYLVGQIKSLEPRLEAADTRIQELEAENTQLKDWDSAQTKARRDLLKTLTKVEAENARYKTALEQIADGETWQIGADVRDNIMRHGFESMSCARAAILSKEGPE